MPEIRPHRALRTPRIVAVLLAAIVACALIAFPAAAAGSNLAAARTYTESTEIIGNPERGLYRYDVDCDGKAFDAANLRTYREQRKTTLVLCLFELRNLVNDRIRPEQLTFLQAQANALRAGGIKMVLRFAYNDPAYWDRPLPTVLAHIDQLAPVITKNVDVIAAMEAGFVGRYGEGYYTNHFGNAGSVSPAQWQARKDVVTKLLTTVPNTRMVNVRTPQMKQQFYGIAPVTAAQWQNGSAKSRTGHHNDCFLATNSDRGTFRGGVKTYNNPPPFTGAPLDDYAYLANDTDYVLMGGETCDGARPPLPDRVACPTATRELRLFNYTYLNGSKPPVFERWAAEGCRNEIEQRLGYRLSLVSSNFPAVVKKGAALPVNIVIRNTGWAAPINPRPVNLVLRARGAGGGTSVTRLNTDLRKWAPGSTTTLNQQVTFPTALRPGTYDVFLSLPDAATSLAKTPAYAIQLANVGTWEGATGYNNLLTSITFQ